MKSSADFLLLASVASCFLGTSGFVAPSNLARGGVISSGTHDVSSRSICGGGSSGSTSSSSSSRHLLATHRTSRRSRCEPSSLIMMAAAGKKRKRRKGGKIDSAASSSVSTPKQPAATPGSKRKGGDAGGADAGGGVGAGQLGDVLEGDRGVEVLFTDDWSDMPANTGMVKSNVPLPDITEFKPTRRAETTLEQREKKSAVGLMVGAAGDDAVPASRLDGFESKLTPIVDREEERRKKSAAERFEEGPVIKALKTATWFSICTLVLWEIYINSPWFHTPEAPPIL